MEDGSKCHFNTTLSRFCALENELPVQCQIPPPLSRRCWKIGTDDDAYTAYEMCCSRSEYTAYIIMSVAKVWSLVLRHRLSIGVVTATALLLVTVESKQLSLMHRGILFWRF